MGCVVDKAWWSRGDQRALELAFGLAALVVGVFMLLVPVLGAVGVLDPFDGREVPLKFGTQSPEGLGGDGIVVRGLERAEIVVVDPSFAQRVLLALPGVFGGVLLLMILLLLLKVIRTLRTGEVFATRNVTRLRIIAATVLAMGVLEPVVETGTTALLLRGTAVSAAVPVTVTIQFGYLLGGLLVAAIAEVLRRGAILRADADGLV
ncbi:MULTISPECIES: DUF2975 domain-containing protein [unclassified Nocardia]|uniref:DUF2975 domain-containing protein n=1 Tax=unclassified Nocardia TaxID=2637762 RepID=UPI0024A91727|nr:MULTISPECIES: DUF2975 domain-containing protein [unclassified Nocardia]